MKHLNIEILRESVKELLIRISRELEPSLVTKISAMRDFYQLELQKKQEKTPSLEASLMALDMILENLSIAASTSLPMCQDTGMVVAFITLGTQETLTIHEIQKALYWGVQEATKEGFFRSSVVHDPLFLRSNTKTNLPPVLYWEATQEEKSSITCMLKGFGSENCSSVVMLSPTAQKETVIEHVCDIVRKAGGKPCPPIVVGVGLGGTMDQAAMLSKKALCREIGVRNKDPQYAELETTLSDSLQLLDIGPGGFGGPLTVLDVAIEYVATHIAGLPLAVSISCWADRKGTISW